MPGQTRRRIVGSVTKQMVKLLKNHGSPDTVTLIPVEVASVSEPKDVTLMHDHDYAAIGSMETVPS